MKCIVYLLLGSKARDAVLDRLVDALGHPLERQATVDALDGAGNRRLDALGSALGRVHKEVDVAFPSRRPLGRLVGELLLCTRHDHVEGGQDADASESNKEELGALGVRETGDTRSHCDGCVCLCVGLLVSDCYVKFGQQLAVVRNSERVSSTYRLLERVSAMKEYDEMSIVRQV